MPSSTENPAATEEYPRRVSLFELMKQNPLPFIQPGTINAAEMTPDATKTHAIAVVDAFNAAIGAEDEKALAALMSQQTLFKDVLAMTSHYRTFKGAEVIAPVLLQLSKLRGLKEPMKITSAVFVPATPVLQFIDMWLSFKTTSPAATNAARVLLVPFADGDGMQWKIWILSTSLEDLDIHPQNEALLQKPGRDLTDVTNISCDVLIIGAGNAAAALATRLKTLGIDSILLERNERPGDNWRNRYECMKFHIPTEACHLPFMPYASKLHTPHLLSKDELADQMESYIQEFQLNVFYSAKVNITTYDSGTKTWTVTFQTPSKEVTVTCKHLVQATGLGSQKPRVPRLLEEGTYKGTGIHSVQFKSGEDLKNKGIKSVLIVGSANTAFDVMEDCHKAGLVTTMNVRSPTFVLPLDYVCNDHALGAYVVHGVERADQRFLTVPSPIESQLNRGLFTALASQDQDRYKGLSAAGFPVISGDNPAAALSSYVLERGGGHYIDMGATRLLAEGKVDIKANVEPVAYTPTGVKFSDQTELDVDAIVWCTGFADLNARHTVANVLGQENCQGRQFGEGILGPKDVADRVDATWGLDEEGELRGMWKRHLRLEKFWIMGGFASQHRWHSRFLALQIKADLEGILPSAFRETPNSLAVETKA